MKLEDSIDAGVVELHSGNGFIAIARQRTGHVDRHGLCGVCMLNVIQNRTAEWSRNSCTVQCRRHAAGDGISLFIHVWPP